MTDTTPKRPSEEARKKILDASRALFAGKGFDGTGIDAIARGAGVAKSLIYYYFENKDAILQAILERYVDEAVQLERETVTAILADPPGKLRDCMAAALETMEANQDVIRIMAMEALKGSSTDRVMPPLRRAMRAGLDAVRQAGFDELDQADLALKGLFLAFGPLASFVLFKDAWCSSTGVDPKWARERFLDAIANPRLHDLLAPPQRRR